MRHTTSCAILSAVIATAATASEPPHFAYTGERGPAHWGSLAPEYAACGAGVNQSPVDLAGVVAAELAPLGLSSRDAEASLVNNGHAIQVDLAGDAGSLGDRGHVFALKQFHFHTPSEHHVDGREFPGEIHFVHADAYGALAVVGVLVEAGAENEALATVIANAPRKHGERVALAGTMNAGTILPTRRDHMSYSGSLTTPPCSEGVRWFVMTEKVTLSQAQLDALRTAVGFANDRPVQPIGARLVVD